MGRSHVEPIQQPNDVTCGPAAIKHALTALGMRKSLSLIINLCKTTRNGTSTTNLIRALNKLGLHVLAVEYATLHHLQSALRYQAYDVRAILVSYLYDLNDKYEPQPESGHWAMVSSYLSSKSRIVLLDSATGRKKSYDWSDFRSRWIDYDYKRQRIGKTGKHYKLVRSWQTQLMLVVAKDKTSLPKFRIKTAQHYEPIRQIVRPKRLKLDLTIPTIKSSNVIPAALYDTVMP